MSNQKFTEMKAAMLMNVPFFASLLLDRMTIKVGAFDHIPTAGTDGKTVWFNEEFLNSLTLKEALFVCCHEVAHAMWMHMERGKQYHDQQSVNGKPYNDKKWNYACDYVINDLLVESGIGSMPKDGLRDHRFTSAMSAEEVYALLPDDPSGGGGGKGGFDVHVLAPGEASQEEWKRAIAAAVQAAKRAGKLPGELERFAERLLNPQVTWQEVLRRRIMTLVGRDSHTWAKLHRRRLMSQGVVMPGNCGHAAGTIVVAVDTSGSIGPAELTTFLSEVQGILDDVQPETTILIACDARIADVHHLYPGDDLATIKPKMGGGGGTSFIPPFEWVEQNNVTPDTLVYLTDMCGTFPQQPSYPVVWCATEETEGPFGETIHVAIRGDA